jgi:hypothetical protein
MHMHDKGTALENSQTQALNTTCTVSQVCLCSVKVAIAMTAERP